MYSRIMILPVLAVLTGPVVASAADPVKTFPVSKCRYTLPGKDWSWVEPVPAAEFLCVAESRDGLTLMLMVLHAPTGSVVDADVSAGFDEGFAAAAGARKRGGRFSTFKGLPCYESEWVLKGQCTLASRVVIANGFAYQLQLLGNADPVEQRPDFEAIMNGFEFTSPPVAPVPRSRGAAVAGTIGGLLPYGIFWACVILLWLGSRKKSSGART
jgi:hypothetical protein